MNRPPELEELTKVTTICYPFPHEVFISSYKHPFPGCVIVRSNDEHKAALEWRLTAVSAQELGKELAKQGRRLAKYHREQAGE